MRAALPVLRERACDLPRPTAGARGRRVSTSPSPPGRSWRWWGSPGAASRPSPAPSVGLVKPEAGAVTFDGTPVTTLGLRRRPAELTRIQMVFQDPYASLHPRRAIGVQIGDGVRAAVARGEASSGLRNGWNASDSTPCRFALPARVLRRPAPAHRDRPIPRGPAGPADRRRADLGPGRLDTGGVAALMRDLARGRGAGLLFISHDLSVVRLIADRTLVMYRGRIVESGAAETSGATPLHPYTQALLRSHPGAGRSRACFRSHRSTPLERSWTDDVPEALERTPA